MRVFNQDAPWPEDLRAWLEDNKPDIDVDDSSEQAQIAFYL